MSKKKNNTAASKAVENENSVIDTEVVEAPVSEEVETPTEETPAVDTVETEVPTDSAPATEETQVSEEVETPATDTEETEAPTDEVSTETPVSDSEEKSETSTLDTDNVPTDSVPDASAPATDEASTETPVSDFEEKPEAPVTETPEKPETPVDDTDKQNTVNSEIMNKELMISYKVRFAFNQSSKKYAAQRNMTLFNMIDLFMTNRQGFVGCVEQKDFDHIKDFVLHNPIIYKYQEFKLEGRKQFIERLEINTDYVINHLK